MEWFAIPFSRGTFQPRDLNHSSCIGRQVLCQLHHLGCHLDSKRSFKSTVVPCPTIINSATMNIGVHVSLSDLVSSVCMPRSGIAGSYGSSNPSF